MAKKITFLNSKQLSNTPGGIGKFKTLFLTMVLGLLSFSAVNAQNDINFRNYSGSQLDLDALDAYFDNVNSISVTGGNITYNGANRGAFLVVREQDLPTDVNDLAGVDMIAIGEGWNGYHTQEQIDMVVEFVRQGGVLIANMEGTTILDPRNGIRPAYIGAYLANTFICSDTYIMHTNIANGTDADSRNSETGVESTSGIPADPKAYHPGMGNLNLTAPGYDGPNPSTGTIQNYRLGQSEISWYVGVPPENAILYANQKWGTFGSSGVNATCANTPVIDLVFPAYPGTENECGIKGMALISGEQGGILSNANRSSFQYNWNMASLVYDFLYDPAAMAVRNAWSDNPANVNADCEPGTGGPSGPSGPSTPTAEGVVDCSKTQITTAPVAGVPGQKTLLVTIDVTTAGCFSPITVSGSGISLANSLLEVCTETTGIQTFAIPVDYDGSALGTMTFTVGTSGTCTADLTVTPKNAVSEIWTLDCVPTVGPELSAPSFN